MCAEEHSLAVSELALQRYTRPRKRQASYVALYDEATGKATGKKLYLTMAIRRGKQDLQALAEHINSKIESLLHSNVTTSLFSAKLNRHKEAEAPRVCTLFFSPRMVYTASRVVLVLHV